MPEIVRHPLIWDEISICRDHGIKCFLEEAADAAAAAERARIRAAVEGLRREKPWPQFVTAADMAEAARVANNNVVDDVLAIIDREQP